MRIATGCLGAVIGGPAAFVLVGHGFRLLNPARGCMSGLDAFRALPLMALGLVIGAVAGACAANGCLTLLWTWQARHKYRQRGRPREDG
jgi:hypothetical protein